MGFLSSFPKKGKKTHHAHPQTVSSFEIKILSLALTLWGQGFVMATVRGEGEFVSLHTDVELLAAGTLTLS